MAAPALVFWERNAPFAAVAASRLAGVPVALQADPKATKDTVAALKFAGGCARGSGRAPCTRPSCRPPDRAPRPAAPLARRASRAQRTRLTAAPAAPRIRAAGTS